MMFLFLSILLQTYTVLSLFFVNLNMLYILSLEQMIMVKEKGDHSAPDTLEYRHGLTPPMRDVRKRRFRREPVLNVC